MLALGWVVAAWLACSESETRPPLSGDCNEPACLEGLRGNPSGIGAGIPGGAAGSGGGGGSGGGAGMPPPAAGTLTGSVTMIVEPDLSQSGNPEAPVELRVASASGADVVGASRADGSFLLDGVSVGDSVWAAVGTFARPPAPPFVDTIQLVDTSVAEPVELVVMRRSALETLALSSFFAEPVELDFDRGHAIIRFVDDEGAPVPGLSVVFPAPEDADIAYDAGEIYSDLSFETSTRGTIALINMAAAAYPGGPANLVVELASTPVVQFRPNVRLVSGAVTVLTVELDLEP